MSNMNTNAPNADWLADGVGEENLVERLWFRNWVRWRGDEEAKEMVKRGWLADDAKERPN